ncbi:MAG: cytochrome c3 family protein [Proteobacteria bacterium]|nr:cytochrome c3 family protein [Pseudomonadota bacterium]MBU4296481.1 cytochrome c3 family protein [Pseudomonadota bacterium]MCG2749663.1 cytochrome c3 family protein [Desulfobulbaceae bacterium]
MNIDQRGFARFFSVLVAAGLLLVLAGGQAVGEEEYDEDAYGPQAPIVFIAPVKAVVFSHKTHTMDAGLECDSCHDEIFQMESGSTEQNDDFTMQSLYDGKYCGACHDGETAFASNTRCTVCHIGVKGFDRMQGGQKTDAHGGHH